MNAVAGHTGHLLHVTDELTGELWLVDSGAVVSILPPTTQQRRIGPNGTKLSAANGSPIPIYGSVSKTLKIGDQTFDFVFTVADVRQRIIGADFLAAHYLAPNIRDALLLNLQDFSSLPAQHVHKENHSSINFVDENPCYKLLDSFPEILTPSFTLHEPIHGVKHHIPTEGPPVQARARRLDPEKLSVAKKEIEKLVDLGVCYRGKSEWASPLLVTTKPCGGWRVCGDYRRLNGMTKDDRYPVRSLQDFTAELHGKKFFSKVDLMKGYHQIPVADEDVPKTAVITPFGLFIFPRTPFGLKNAGQDFQRLMDEILGDIPRVYVYIDDILIASETLEQHLEDLEQVFKTLAANGLVVQRSKCVLGKSSLEFLGYQVDSNGISPLQDRVTAISAASPPTTIKELQRFLGMVGYYRRFIPKAATHLYHLFECLKGKPKTLTWTDDCQRSFEATKKALAEAALLHHPRPGAPIALTTDASNTAIGGVLEQRGPRGWEPLAFYSSKLQANQQTWPPYERELLAAYKGIRHFRDMLEGRNFTLYTDHQSLVPSLYKKTDPQTIKQQYQLSYIAEYTSDIRYVQGKANLVADALSRPSEPNSTISSVTQVTPQSSTHEQGRKSQSGQPCRVTPGDRGTLGEDGEPDSRHFNEPNRLEQPPEPRSASSTLSSGFSPASATESATSPDFQRQACSPPLDLPSQQNWRQSEHSFPSGSPTLPPEPQPSTTNSTDEHSRHVASSKARMEAASDDLASVVASIGSLGIDWNAIALQQPLDPDYRRLKQDARSGLNFKTLDIGSNNLIVDVSNGPARPFVPFAFRRRVFDVMHGLGHPGVERTRQSICSKVVWPSMREDVTRWARECTACQQAKVTKNVVPPIGEFVVPNKRFEHLNVDLVTLPRSNGFKYLLTAVDRFTRWPVAVPLTDITAESVCNAFAYGWIQHFGVPSTITTDRGSQFSSEIFLQLTKTWGIKTLMTTAYHPEANGLVERLHRRLKESLIALGRETPEEWFWRLPCALLAIRTTLKPDLGASPADLVFGEGLAVPGEVLPSSPATDDQLARQREAALADLRIEVARLQPTPTSAHRRPNVHLPEDLQRCSHVFVRRGGITSSLASPYVGPFRVIDRNQVNFKVAMPGRGSEAVAIARIKPAVIAVDDVEVDPPAPPRPPGRPPGPRTRQPQPTSRQTRSQRRQRRQRHFSQPQDQPEDLEQPVDDHMQPQVQDEFDHQLFSPPASPAGHRNWGDTEDELEEEAELPPAPPTPRQRSPSPPRTSTVPDVVERPQPPPNPRYSLRPRPGNFSYRPRPDVSVIFQHLQLQEPSPSPFHDRAGGFFPDIMSDAGSKKPEVSETPTD